LSVVEERAYIETDDHDQTQDEPIGEHSNSDRMVPISDALVVKQRETIKFDCPQSTISRPTPIVDFIPTPPHLQGRNPGAQFVITPGQRNQSLWDKVWTLSMLTLSELLILNQGLLRKDLIQHRSRTNTLVNVVIKSGGCFHHPPCIRMGRIHCRKEGG
jgi:hypothetical protein